MRILQVIHDFLPDHCAGSEIYTYHLSKALQARGHHVTLLFTEKRDDRPQFECRRGEYEALPFHEIVYNRLFHDIADLYDDPRMEAPIGRVLDEVVPDVIHVQSLVYLGLGLLRQAAARSIPTAMTLHEYYVTCARGGLRLDLQGNLCDPIDYGECARCLSPYPIERSRYVEPGAAPSEVGAAPPEVGSSEDLRLFARAAKLRRERMFDGVRSVARFVAPSQFLRDRLVADGLPAEKVEVADYGFPSVPPLRRRTRAPGEPLRLGYLGTISDYKGVDIAIEAFASLPEGVAELRVFGDTSWFPDFTGPLLRRWGKTEGLSFEGVIPAATAPDRLAEMDLLIVPSIWFENSPLTIHEAFQCGVPVVTSDLGGMRELVGSGGGLLFERGSSSDLARVLTRVLDEPSLLAELVASIPPVKSIERNAEEMEALLSGLVGL